MFAATQKTPITFETTVAALTAIYPAICIDLETGYPDAEYIERRLAEWKPRANTKEENIPAKREEARQKIMEKSALLDGAPIACIAVVSATDHVIFNSMNQEMIRIPDWRVISAGGEKNMLEQFRLWLEDHTDRGTTLVGHRLTGFDLPKLRRAYAIHRLKIPATLLPPMNGEAQPLADVARMFTYFSTEINTDYVSLETVADYFGVPHAKGLCTGEIVPLLAKQGKIAEVLNYCCTDAAATYRIWQLMTGQAPDLQ